MPPFSSRTTFRVTLSRQAILVTRSSMSRETPETSGDVIAPTIRRRCPPGAGLSLAGPETGGMSVAASASQPNISRLLLRSGARCSPDMRPLYLRKKPVRPWHFASLPGVDSRRRSSSA